MAQPKNKLGKNIRDLRKAHGETQEELGRAINVEHNTISMYESGEREPALQTLQAIASHYGYPLDQLIRDDFSELDFSKIALTWENIVAMIEVICPLLVSDKALKDPHFAKGYEYTRKIVDGFQTPENVVMRSIFERAIEEYSESLEKSETMESAVNILWLIYILYTLLPDEHSIKVGKAILYGKAYGKEFVKNYFLKNSENVNKEEETNKKLYARDMSECILACIEILKSSPEYNHIADYYLALRYIIGVVDTDYGQEINTIIGMEIMLSYLSLGNPYAFAYIEKALFL
ncbi:MAG: helix-turn-helix transcriptional regulator [Oscillospiraceae bacterium]|nr:helix-turn-helix transcriptional regulator [Oscillospiraceae bacterium]